MDEKFLVSRLQSTNHSQNGQLHSPVKIGSDIVLEQTRIH